MWPFGKKGEVAHPTQPLHLFNTLGKEKQVFSLAEHSKIVRMYNCGPTVYGRQHIGNLSMFVFTDVLKRALEYNHFTVKQVINFTDFGHLSSDADEGDDKMVRGLKQEGLEPTMENMKALGRKYAEIFKEDLQKLNIDTDSITFPFASDYIPAQIALIQTLEEKEYAYKTASGVYYDTSRFSRYGELGEIHKEGLREGARVEANPEKRNPADFVLWKSDQKMGWDSPWSKGFPGWHIECSAMIHSVLGKQIDIHTGGIEHIPIHHNNEIAQSEAALGKRPLSRFWLHRAHIQLEGGKMAKSEGNVVYLSDIIEKGFLPLALRYLLLTSHYRTSANFTWVALGAAQSAFARMRRAAYTAKETGTLPERYIKKFRDRINDDLDTSGALAVAWEMMNDKDLDPNDIRAGLFEMDKVFGLNLENFDDFANPKFKKLFGIAEKESDLPEKIQDLINERDVLREDKKWEEADRVRKQIEEAGYTLDDSKRGPRVYKKT